jgi:hypothetical protein
MDLPETLALLSQLTASGRMNRRSRVLLKEPELESPEFWFMRVPSAFNEALDIKQNCGAPNPGWTQSGAFAFKSGDRLYDCSEAYSSWGEALKVMKLGIFIHSASSAGLGDDGSRYGGAVQFTALTPDDACSRMVERFEHSMTQDEFVKMIVEGPTGDFSTLLSPYI